MHMMINGQRLSAIDVKQFRKDMNLPDDFGIRLFEDKDFDGLGRIDNASNELIALRQTVLDAIPTRITLPELLTVVGNTSMVFRLKMYEINDAVGLRPVEIEFAAAGFEDVCQGFAYALIRHKTGGTPLDFSDIYGEWFHGSTRVSSTANPYTHEDKQWEVYVINNVYGRTGLLIHTKNANYCIRDTSFACPAEGFMFTLLRDVTAAILERVS